MKFDYKNYSNQLLSENERLNVIIDELEEKIYKAIKYINRVKNKGYNFGNELSGSEIKYLLEILGDKE